MHNARQTHQLIDNTAVVLGHWLNLLVVLARELVGHGLEIALVVLEQLLAHTRTHVFVRRRKVVVVIQHVRVGQRVVAHGQLLDGLQQKVVGARGATSVAQSLELGLDRLAALQVALAIAVVVLVLEVHFSVARYHLAIAHVLWQNELAIVVVRMARPLLEADPTKVVRT
jgi:hypothetical protein